MTDYSLLNHAPDAIIVADASGKIVFANPRVEDVFGFTSDELLGRSVDDLIPPGARKAHTAHRAAFAAAPRARSMAEGRTLTALRKDGAEVPVEISLSPLKDADGRFTIAAVRDVSSRVLLQKEAELLHQMALTTATAQTYKDALADAIQAICNQTPWTFGVSFLLHRSGATLEPGAAWFPQRGPAEERAFAEIRSFFETLTFTEGQGLCGRVWATGQPEWVDDLSRDGSLSPAVAKAVKAHGIKAALGVPVGPEGNTVAVIVLMRTDAAPRDDRLVRLIVASAAQLASAFARRSAEHALLDAARLAQGIVENSRVPQLVLDADLRIELANPAFHQCFKTTPAETNRRNLFSITDGAWDIPVLKEVLLALLPRNTRYLDLKLEHEFPRVGLKHLILNVRRIYRDDEPTKHVLVSIEDRSVEAELEERVRHTDRLESVGRLAGGVAHDFNNMLMPILGYAELITAQLAADDPAREDLGQIVKAAERAAALTRQLLAFGGKQVLRPRPLDLNTILKGLEGFLSRAIGDNMELRLNLGHDLRKTRIDPSQVEQCVLNLVLNARDAMPGGGVIEIDTRNCELNDAYARAHEGATPGSFVCLAVRDSGAGLDATARAHLFEPFFSTKGGQGTGLGLASVYGIVRQMGGHIAMRSETGQGAEFTLHFPITDEEQDIGAPKQVAASDALATGSESILLVEDDEGVRSTVGRILLRGGYTVLSAATPREALELSRRHRGRIDLLISDVVLPGLSGPELTAQLLASRHELRVILMSGYSDEAITRHGSLGEGMEFMEKPFSVTALLNTVRQLLDRPVK
ncbi:MAG: PAS domain S-box protein [Gemmatimonadota bacterium]